MFPITLYYINVTYCFCGFHSTLLVVNKRKAGEQPTNVYNLECLIVLRHTSIFMHTYASYLRMRVSR